MYIFGQYAKKYQSNLSARRVVAMVKAGDVCCGRCGAWQEWEK
jgi:hypothetical protein